MNSTVTQAGIPRKPRLAADPSEEQTPAARALGNDVFLSLFVACYNESGNIVGTLETVVAAAHSRHEIAHGWPRRFSWVQGSAVHEPCLPQIDFLRHELGSF